MTAWIRSKVKAAREEGATHFTSIKGAQRRPGDYPSIFMAKKVDGEWYYKFLESFDTDHDYEWYTHETKHEHTPLGVGEERLNAYDEKQRQKYAERKAEEKGQMLLL